MPTVSDLESATVGAGPLRLQRRVTWACFLLAWPVAVLAVAVLPADLQVYPLILVNAPSLVITGIAVWLVERGFRSVSAIVLGAGLQLLGVAGGVVFGFHSGALVAPFIATAWVGAFGGPRWTVATSVFGVGWLAALALLQSEPWMAPHPFRTLVGEAAALAFLTLLILDARAQARRALHVASRHAVTAVESAEARRKSEAAYRAIVEGSREGIVLLDLDGHVLTFNAAALATMGWTEEDVKNRPWMGLGVVPADQMPRAMSLFAQVLADGGIDDAEITVLNRAGQRVRLSVASHVLDLPETTSQGLVVRFRDLSREARAAEREQRLAEELHQARRLEALGRLAGGVAHDFNNLLVVIRNNIELLQEEVDDPNGLLSEVADASEQAAGLTTQLLAVGRRQVMKPQRVRWPELIGSLTPLLERLTGERVVLTQFHPPGLPSVEADPAQLQQVLVNLVANAVDAMPSGGTVTLRTSQVLGGHGEAGAPFPAGPWVVLDVIDTGAGMDAATLGKVFEPFFTTKADGGTGLGLATVYGIVQQSGGLLHVESSPGAGAHFRVALPVAGAEDEIDTEVAPPPHAPSPRRVGAVLLVEDRDDVRRATTRLLERHGFTVMAFASPCDALSWTCAPGRDRPDAVLTDLVLPEMDGWTLLERMREAWPGVGAVVMSGDPRGLEHSLPEHARFLAKPFAPAELVDSLRSVM